VTAGVTDCEPDATGVTFPIPWLRLKLVALVVVHESVEVPPAVMVDAEAVSAHVGAFEGEGYVHEAGLEIVAFGL
jgi:hypothetical protein